LPAYIGFYNAVTSGDASRVVSALKDKEGGCHIDTPDAIGKSALMYAAELGSAEVVETLLARGAARHLFDQVRRTETLGPIVSPIPSQV
jgi:Ankyrin repeat